MKVHKGKPEVKQPRIKNLTVRMSAEDLERLERIRPLVSPYAPISQGKVMAAALKALEEKLLK